MPGIFDVGRISVKSLKKSEFLAHLLMKRPGVWGYSSLGAPVNGGIGNVTHPGGASFRETSPGLNGTG